MSLSSAEVEVYACSSGASDAVMLARLIAWMNGSKTTIHLHTDSSGAKGILSMTCFFFPLVRPITL